MAALANTLSVATGQATTGPSVVSLIPDAGEWGFVNTVSGASSYICSSSPTNAPAYLQFGSSLVPDLFKNRSDVVPITGQEVRGRSMLFKLQETWQVANGDGTTIARYPVQAHMVITFGLHDLITSTVLGELYKRMVGIPFRLVGDTPAVAMGKFMTGNTRYDIP